MKSKLYIEEFKDKNYIENILDKFNFYFLEKMIDIYELQV